MSALTQARAAVLLESEYRGTAYTALTAGRRLRLVTNTTTAAFNEATAGTEIATGGNYAAGGPALTFTAATTDAAAPATYSGKVENVSLSITNMPAVSVGGVEVIDGTTGAGTRVAWGLLTTPRTTASGDTLSFPAAAIVARV